MEGAAMFEVGDEVLTPLGNIGTIEETDGSHAIVQYENGSRYGWNLDELKPARVTIQPDSSIHVATDTNPMGDPYDEARDRVTEAELAGDYDTLDRMQEDDILERKRP